MAIGGREKLGTSPHVVGRAVRSAGCVCSVAPLTANLLSSFLHEVIVFWGSRSGGKPHLMGSWAAPLSPFFSGRGGLDLSPLQRACGGGDIRQGVRGQSRSAVFSFVKTSVFVEVSN